MPALAEEGLTAARIGKLTRRVARLEWAMQSIVSRAATMLAPGAWQEGGPVQFEARPFFDLPEELALRLLGRAIDTAGDEGPVELAKLEALLEALYGAKDMRFRRTLAGAVVTIARGSLTVERAPARKHRAPKRP
jgi:tRNA(Ile)-lysidine synthase